MDRNILLSKSELSATFVRLTRLYMFIKECGYQPRFWAREAREDFKRQAWDGEDKCFTLSTLNVTIVFFTSASDSFVPMFQFASLPHVIPLGTRADCSLTEKHGWCFCGLLCFGKWDPKLVARQLCWHLRWSSVGQCRLFSWKSASAQTNKIITRHWYSVNGLFDWRDRWKLTLWYHITCCCFLALKFHFFEIKLINNLPLWGCGGCLFVLISLLYCQKNISLHLS